MFKFIKIEAVTISKKLKTLNSRTIIILLTSTFLFVLSWYFANPNFFQETLTFLQPEELLIEELLAFTYWFLMDIILFFIIPLLIIKLLFHENLESYGIIFRISKIGLIYTAISIFIIIPISYLISQSEDYFNYVPLMQSAKDNIIVFIIYEFFFILYIFSWEFIFRGFMLFGLEKEFGFNAVFIQMIPFVLLHNGKPFLETFSSIFGAFFLGYLALRTGTVVYGFIIHASILVLLDLYAFINN